MKEIKNRIGNVVKVFAETFEYEAYDQVKALSNYDPYLQSKIRIMPDAHAGKGCTVGTTMQLDGAVTPNLVGVDIGCGMYVVALKDSNIDLKMLNEVINCYVPSGFNTHIRVMEPFDFDNLRCGDEVDLKRAMLSIGTLGGGNHYIEIDRSENGQLFLVIHSGSRNLGVQVCKYYQDKAYKALNEVSTARDNIVSKLKAEGRANEIEKTLKDYRKPSANKDLAHLTGKEYCNYIHDMQIVQKYASVNREAIANIIISKAGLSRSWDFTTIHNYIDIRRNILRKGAVSAENGERLIIPMNMRDGALLCIGKGNEDWNWSAPHGAGRLMSRGKAKEQILFKDFQETMENVFSTSVCQSTLDEAPQAYKPMEEIIEAIGDTVSVYDIIKPIYNYKAH